MINFRKYLTLGRLLSQKSNNNYESNNRNADA